MPFLSSSGQPKGLPVSVYGDGSLGDVVYSADDFLDFENNFNNLTIDAGVTLTNFDGIIHVKGILTLNGTIKSYGPGGGDATVSSGGARSGPGGDGIYGSGGASKAGGDGSTTNGVNAIGVAVQILTYGGRGGVGGDAGVGSVGTYGTGSAGQGISHISPANIIQVLSMFINTYAEGNSVGGGAGGGGGGGGGDTVQAGGGGGGGGYGPTPLVICAKEIRGTGLLDCSGGKGGNAADGVGGNTGGGGGGGGAGGGSIIVVSDKISNFTTNVVGGAGGTKGLKSGTGTNGIDGVAGVNGTLVVYNRINDTAVVT